MVANGGASSTILVVNGSTITEINETNAGGILCATDSYVYSTGYTTKGVLLRIPYTNLTHEGIEILDWFDYTNLYDMQYDKNNNRLVICGDSFSLVGGRSSSNSFAIFDFMDEAKQEIEYYSSSGTGLVLTSLSQGIHSNYYVTGESTHNNPLLVGKFDPFSGEGITINGVEILQNKSMTFRYIDGSWTN